MKTKCPACGHEDPKTEKFLKDQVTMLANQLIQYKQVPTLRDQFAMAALTGLLANSYADGHSQPNCTAPPEVFAQWAYSQADAMLEARKQSME